jgi:hypothetical protein
MQIALRGFGIKSFWINRLSRRTALISDSPPEGHYLGIERP